MKPYFYPGPKRICAAAKLAGFPDDGKTDESNPLFVAACIAYAESSGDAWQITKETDGSTSYGLWQINTSHVTVLGIGNWAIYPENARMAFTIWTKAGKKFTDWGAFNNRAFRRTEYVTPVTHGLQDMWYELNTKRYPIERVASCYLEAT
jgi:hypothetical protein